MNADVGFGITETGKTKDVPLQPLSLGVIVKLTMTLGQTKLVNGVEILPPMATFDPDCPSEDVQSKVVPI